MKRCHGIWLPDDETDPVMIGAGARYQSSKLNAAIPYVLQFRNAVDIGAHCGIWTCMLAKQFEQVICFEPLEELAEIWQRNIEEHHCTNATLHQCALGDREGTAHMSRESGKSGASHIDTKGIPVKITKLDNYQLKDVDLIKIDVEGYEPFVLQGGEQTIKSNKPVIIVEAKPGLGTRYNKSDRKALEILQEWGYETVNELAGDYIMVNRNL